MKHLNKQMPSRGGNVFLAVLLICLMAGFSGCGNGPEIEGIILSPSGMGNYTLVIDGENHPVAEQFYYLPLTRGNHTVKGIFVNSDGKEQVFGEVDFQVETDEYSSKTTKFLVNLSGRCFAATDIKPLYWNSGKDTGARILDYTCGEKRVAQFVASEDLKGILEKAPLTKKISKETKDMVYLVSFPKEESGSRQAISAYVNQKIR